LAPSPTAFVTLLKTFGKNVSGETARIILKDHENFEHRVFLGNFMPVLEILRKILKISSLALRARELEFFYVIC
jgi:hypothetical protein